MSLLKSSALRQPQPAYTACISACEACVMACEACARASGRQWANGSGPLVNLSSCTQCCELAIHAMADHRAEVPATCAACARSCEALARDCMLLATPESGRCAQACYRAAQECRRLTFPAPYLSVPPRAGRKAEGSTKSLTAPLPS